MKTMKFLSSDIYSDCPELFDEFVDLTVEQLQLIEIQLIDLEKDFQNGEAIDSVMRHLHSIKGATLNLELEELGHLVHAAENIMDLARSKKISLNNESINLLFEFIDVTKLHLEDIQQARENNAQLQGVNVHIELMTRLKSFGVNHQ